MLPTPVKLKVLFMLVLTSIQTLSSNCPIPINGEGRKKYRTYMCMQANWIILFSLFILFKTMPYVTKPSKTKSSLHAGSKYRRNTLIKFSKPKSKGGDKIICSAYVEHSWMTLFPLFTLVKTRPYLTNASKTKRSLNGASE